MKENRVGPQDVAARLREEFPGVEVVITNEVGLEADIAVSTHAPDVVYKRMKELEARAQLFNMHMDVGHRSRKTKWWNI